MDRYVAIFVGCPVAFLILYFRYRINEIVGTISFAETIFGQGGTYTFILVFGVLLFVFSLMWGFGAFQKYIFGMIGTFF